MPARNEAENIGPVLDGIEACGIRAVADVLVIDDASEDATPRIAAERGYPVLSTVFCLGYGGALQVGYKYAVREGYRYLIQMDADGQHDPCNLPVLYRRLLEEDRPDIVLGSRYLEGSRSFPLSLAKRLAHRLFRFIIRAAAGRRVTDPTSGLQGLSRRAFSCYAHYDLFDTRYPDANMIVQMLLLGFRLVEVPAVLHARQAGESIHSGLKPVWYMPRMVFTTLAVIVRIRILKIGAEAGQPPPL